MELEERMNYEFDGKLHALYDKYGYAILKYEKEEEIAHLTFKLAEEYSVYSKGQENPDVEIIIKPPCFASLFQQFGTVGIKFKRYEGDGLV